jgi:Domain of unknown function (DUF4336)
MSVPTQIAEALWTFDGPVVDWFFPFPTRMTIARLADDDLFIHSPIALTAEVRKAVEALGAPRYIVSPNKMHHLFWAEWQETYKDAFSFSPPALREKRPDLKFYGALGDRPFPAWESQLDQMVFKGSRFLDEVIFFHRPSKTVIFGDLLENLDPAPLSKFQRLLARMGGVTAPHGGTPLDYRFSFMMHRDEARACVQRIVDWGPRQIIMCHGVLVREDAVPFIESAFAWLGKRPRS